jgi:hypothetical protein
MLGDEIDGNRLPDWVTNSKQTTDGHLLELARSHSVQFATFDTRIPGAVLIPEYIASSTSVREPTVPYGALDITRRRSELGAGTQFANAPPVPRVDLLSVPANSMGG